MGYKCTFMDNETYTAQDVNEMFSHLTSQGVCFSDTGSTLSDLNAATSGAVTEGVMDQSSCLVVKEDGVYKISKGVCFMSDGSAITFDEDGEEIVPISGATSYVYIERNIPENCIDIVVSQSAGGDESVPLAEIDADDVIHDKRKLAKSKVVLGVADTLRNFTQEIVFEDYNTPEYTVEIGEGFTYFILWNVGGKYYPGAENLIAIADGETIKITIRTQAGGLGSVQGYLNVKRDGNNLIMQGKNIYYNSAGTVNFAVI